MHFFFSSNTDSSGCFRLHDPWLPLSWFSVLPSTHNMQIWCRMAAPAPLCDYIPSIKKGKRGKRGPASPLKDSYWKLYILYLFASYCKILVTWTHLAWGRLGNAILLQVDICIGKNLEFYYCGRRRERKQVVTSSLDHCYRKKKGALEISSSAIDCVIFSRILALALSF